MFSHSWFIFSQKHLLAAQLTLGTTLGAGALATPRKGNPRPSVLVTTPPSLLLRLLRRADRPEATLSFLRTPFKYPGTWLVSWGCAYIKEYSWEARSEIL